MPYARQNGLSPPMIWFDLLLSLSSIWTPIQNVPECPVPRLFAASGAVFLTETLCLTYQMIIDGRLTRVIKPLCVSGDGRVATGADLFLSSYQARISAKFLQRMHISSSTLRRESDTYYLPAIFYNFASLGCSTFWHDQQPSVSQA